MTIFISNNKGQGLLELIVAIGIITTGLFAVWTLFLSNFSSEQEAKARIIGVNLAREGIEAVKNIRDSNWLKIDAGQDIAWDNFGSGSDGTAVIDNLFADDLQLNYEPDNFDDEETRLYFNNSGFYTGDNSGSLTHYKRLLTISNICCEDVLPSGGDFFCDDFNDDFDIKSPGQLCDSSQIKVGVDVQSEVRWVLRGGQGRKVILQDQFFNWR